MRLKDAPAQDGMRWMQRGLQVFFSQPFGFAGLLGTFLIYALLVSLLPAIGPVLTMMGFPLLTLAFMAGTAEALHGRMPTPRLLFYPLRQRDPRRLELIKLGLAYAVITTLVALLSGAIDGGRMEALQVALMDDKSTQEDIDALLQDPQLLMGILVRMGLTALAAIPFWHAPALTHWAHQSWIQSLFSSTLACWRNKGALTIYAISWVALGAALLSGVKLLLSALGQATLAPVVVLPLALAVSTAFYASGYFTFVGSFEPSEPSDEPPSSGLGDDHSTLL